MTPQTPAQGILVSGDWGDTKSYEIICGCGQPDHQHNVWVEADETGINVTIYVTVQSPFWSMNRWRQIWALLTKGYLQHETTICMDKQVALNYADVLKLAIKDTEEFRNARKN